MPFSASDVPSRSRTATIYALLLLLAFLTRFPFFFHDEINWDESTFILIGQSFLDGHLPYVTLFDLKPPLLFGFFAAVIWIGGKSIVAIRLAGMVCVWVVACFTCDVARRLWNVRAGAVAGSLYVIASAVIAHTSGQATMSETVALVPLIGSLLLLLRTSNSGWALFLAGGLIATAALVRSNLVFVAFAVGVWTLVSRRTRPPSDLARQVLAYCTGGGLIVLLIYVPYGLSHEGRLFWHAVFLGPIIYSSNQLGPLAVGARQVRNALGIFPGQWFPNSENMLGLGIWLPAAIGLLQAIRRRRSSPGATGHAQSLTGTYTLAVALSIAFGGAPYSHYLIQLLPFACVYGTAVYLRLADYPVRRRFGAPLAGMLLALALLPVARQYSIVLTRMRSGAPLAYGASYDIAKILRPACVNGCSLYMLTDQLVYWLLHVTPPSRLAVHPADVVMDYAIRAADGPTATPESEIRQILATAPKYIVKPDVIWYLGASPALDALDSTVKDHYKILATTGDLKIYQRIAPHVE
jgi:Dolichyl-phosphate-mannose-protein mannosyltransferase